MIGISRSTKRPSPGSEAKEQRTHHGNIKRRQEKLYLSECSQQLKSDQSGKPNLTRCMFKTNSLIFHICNKVV